MAAVKPDEKDTGGVLDGWGFDDVLQDGEAVWTEDMLPKFETPMGPVTPQVAVKSTTPATQQPAGPTSQPSDVDAPKPAEKPGGKAARPRPEPPRESVREAQFVPLGSTSQIRSASNIDLLQDVPLPVTVELGRTTMLVREILGLGPGSIIELDRAAGEMVDVMVNGKLIARGEVVVIDENFGVRITEIASETQRGGHNE